MTVFGLTDERGASLSARPGRWGTYRYPVTTAKGAMAVYDLKMAMRMCHFNEIEY
jgi:hypothetical protein